MKEIDWSSILPSYEEIFLAGIHYGRKRIVKHPKMDPYIYAQKEEIYLIDLVKTREKLKEAAEFLREVKENGGIILWVSLADFSNEGIFDIANAADMPYIQGRWVGGLLTNFRTIQERIKYFLEMRTKYENKEFIESLTKREKHKFEREFKSIEKKFGGLEKLSRLPDVLFLTSLKRGELAIREAKRIGIKIVAITNTDSDPTLVDYPIPANDNGRQSVNMILGVIKKAILYK